MDEFLNRLKPLWARIRYEFDQTMAAGPISMIGWLGVVSLLVILLAAAFLAATRIAPPDAGGGGLGFIEAFWEVTMRTIDAGNVGGDNGWDFRLVMLAVTVWGIFVVSSLIGLLSAGVQSQLEELRKGRSVVLERGHIVILNWSNSIFDIMRELIIAHAKDSRFSIVVLADKDKVEMEDEIAAKVKPPSNVRIVCRSGDPGALSDLEIVNLDTARSIVIVASDHDDADAQNIKVVLALVHGPNRRVEHYKVAAEFRSTRSAEIARGIGRGEVQAVVPDDLISRIIVHSSRHTGLSAVYSELLDFAGSEFYAVPLPQLSGVKFGEALLRVSPGTLVGVCDSDGKVRLNPPMDLVVTETMLAIVVAEDRDSIGVLAAAPAFTQSPSPNAVDATGQRPERALIIGWNRRGGDIARQLSSYMAPGSDITIAAATEAFETEGRQLTLPHAHVTLACVTADGRDHAALDALRPGDYDRIVVLSCSDTLPVQAADTQTLVTLLHLREITAAAGRRGILVSEMADIRNRELAAITRADDFVVSNRLVSLMLAQAAENQFASSIFTELLDIEGSEIYMRPVESVIAIDKPTSFFTIIDAARRRGETALGYCRPRGDRANPSGVVLNPAKSEKITFKPGDYIAVLAEQ